MPQDRLTNRLGSWKRQLIDLSRRNRLLNYRRTKLSTVEVVDGVPQFILGHLLSGNTFKFDARPEADSDDQETEDPSPNVGRSFETGRALRHFSAETLDDRHMTDRLQTELDQQRLDKNLLAIYRRAEASLEEQGVNTLFLALGMLQWYESENSDEVSKAPLIMVPVKLRRRSAASPFTLSLGDDDPVLNPAIVEKLRLDFRIELPDLPELSDDLDVDSVFDGIRKAVSGLSRWNLTFDVALGLFSFQKFIMYRDIERNEERFREHEVIRAICQEQEDRGGSAELPPEVANADLDEEMSPWSAVQVLDADSSQQRAILAVKKDHHLVIEGPPGTGKSQTITNLIADALHDGKTVLFVAEKMAALEVVKSRLEHEAGLGDYVLELHSNKTSKREFVETLTRSLDRVEEGDGSHEDELRHLQRLTGELREYVIQLHAPAEPLGMSPFEAIGALAQVDEEEALRDADVPNVTQTTAEALAVACDRLDDLSGTLREIGDPSVHPLRGVGLESAGRADRSRLEKAIEDTAAALSELIDSANEVSETLGLRSAQTLGDATALAGGARIIVQSPGADVAVLQNSGWDEMSSDLANLLDTGERYARTRPSLNHRFRREILDADLSTDVAEYASDIERGIKRFLLPSFWRVRARLRRLLAPEYRPESAAAFLTDLRRAEACKADRRSVRDAEEMGSSLFGSRWKGPESDWPDLRAFAEWVVQFRRYLVQDVLDTRGLEIAAAATSDGGESDGQIRELEQATEQARAALESLIEAGAFEEDSGISVEPQTRIGELAMRVDEMESGLDHLSAYTAFVAARRACEKTIAGAFTYEATAVRIDPKHLTAAFRKLFFESWLEQVFEDRPVLARFHAAQHEEHIRSFRNLDRSSLDMAKDRARARLAERRQELVKPGLQPQLQILQREARRRRRIMPVRKLLSATPDAIQAIKPCFMMSPLSVAQYVDPAVMDFDLIVFDEASQIPPPDAIGAIIRADQVVVVGDSKQLPPTNFFGVHLDEFEDEEDEDAQWLEDLESILDEASVAGIPSIRLKWHYRSQHQSLIRFSNEEFYSDDPLYVFPAAVLDDEQLGLKFSFVEDGVYEGGGQNSVEARRVAEAVIEHVRRFPRLSLGVGTFGIKQQQRILDELDQLRREDSSVEWFFNQEGEKKFFVKNLENIQGDDRDVIMLSVTYGPDSDGVIRRNFGPINQDGGWRRLNVLTTRAKRLLRVFSSMHGDQIDAANVNEGAVLLRQYLTYAETGEYPSAKIPRGTPDSPFETAVMRALERRGYRTVPQVGEAGYRIDIGILDPDAPGRYVCGIECDGATYHSAATVRDRDRLRQQVLELRGWDIHRVWSTDWFHDPTAQIERLVRLINESREHPRRAPSSSVEPTTPAKVMPEDNEPWDTQEGEERETRPDIAEIDVPLYRFAPIRIEGTAEAFYTVPLDSIARAAHRILEVEAPIHQTELARRVAACWGMERAGSQILQRVERGVSRLTRRGLVVLEGDFVMMANGSPVPVRSRAIDGYNFSSDHIAPREVAEAVRLLLRHRAPLLPDEIITETARLLGFARTGTKLRRSIGAARDQLVANGELRPGSRGIYLADEV